MSGKRWYQSRVLWMNAGFAALTVVEANLSLLKDSLGATGYIVALAVVAAANAGMRFLTTQPITAAPGETK